MATYNGWTIVTMPATPSAATLEFTMQNIVATSGSPFTGQQQGTGLGRELDGSIDPAARFRGRYSTRREALIAIRDETGKASVDSIIHHVTSDLQMPPVAPLQAQRGDLALIERGRDVSLGIVSLNGIHLIVTSERGLWRIPRELSVEAWRV
jgi:hypothetical protein